MIGIQTHEGLLGDEEEVCEVHPEFINLSVPEKTCFRDMTRNKNIFLNLSREEGAAKEVEVIQEEEAEAAIEVITEEVQILAKIQEKTLDKIIQVLISQEKTQLNQTKSKEIYGDKMLIKTNNQLQGRIKSNFKT